MFAFSQNNLSLTIGGELSECDVRLVDGDIYVNIEELTDELSYEYSYDSKSGEVAIGNRYLRTVVSEVIDGDTFSTVINGVEEKVRLLLVDTPETVHPNKPAQPFGKEASDFTKDKLTGKEVVLKFDVQERDKYGRLLAYVYLEDGTLFNELLLMNGLARVSVYPPNVQMVEQFRHVESEAKGYKVGIWKDYQEPIITNIIGSINSNKYHDVNCRWAEKISKENAIYFDSVEEAEAQGYEACGVCGGVSK